MDIFNKPVKVNWEGLAPLPVGRSAHTAVLLQGSVYVGGGYEEKSNADSKKSYRLDIYNVTTNRWDYSSITTPYSLFAMTVVDDKLIIAGGCNDTHMVSNKVYVLDRGRWKDYSTMLTGRVHFSAVGYRSMLITVGGIIKINGKWTALATTELLDTSNGCWYTCDDLPVSRSQLKAAVVNNVLYLLGGYTAGLKPSSQVFTASLDNLSSHQLKWQSLPDTPWCHSTPVVLYNKFFITVGGRRSTDKTSQTSEVCAFNPSTGVWKQKANAPVARSSPGIASLTEDTFIMMGGVNQGNRFCDAYFGQCI